MDFEQGLQIADEVVFMRTGRRLSPVEIMVLRGCWEDQTYDQIADSTAYSISYISRTVAPKLWQTLSDSFGEKAGKKNLRFILERYLHKQSRSLTPPFLPPLPSVQDAPPPQTVPSQDHSPLETAALTRAATSHASAVETTEVQIDWSDVMDVSVFHGRQNDLDLLTQWIALERCRLVALLGMGGMGKTTLAVKWAKARIEAESDQRQLARDPIASHSLPAPNGTFQFVLWRSLRHAPPLQTLLLDLVGFLSAEAIATPGISALLQCLRQYRCLILLDGLENLLEPGGVGQFRAGYEDYGELLRLVGETGHQSCLFITSREQLAEVSVLEGIESAVRSLRLEGSPEAVQAILQDKGLMGTEEQKHCLGNLYGNNPLALKIVATSIQELFEGSIESFLSEETLLFNGVRRLLDQHFSRLSALEQSILYWLAVNRDWTRSNELQADMVPPVSKARLLEALEALSLRSLIERQTNRYTLQPAMMEYVMEQFTERLVEELKTAKLSLFLNHAILKATAPDTVSLNQKTFILRSIANQLSRQFGSLAALEQETLHILTQLRRSADQTAGYGAGNLLNLMNQLGLDLTSYNFSNLTVWQADLQTAILHQVNFAEADLTHTVFAQTVRGDRPYEGMNITGTTGLSGTQKELLKQMGAVEHRS